MATFSAQVVDLVGTFSDETALDSFITAGANEVINAMPRPMQERVAEETSFTNTTTSEGSKVLHVLRNDGTIDQPCRRIPARYRGRIQDSSDMQYATSTDPAYYVQDAAVTIFPTGTGKLVSIPTYSEASPLDASAISAITNFPNEAEYLVILYAAIKALQQNMSGITLASASISYSNASVGDGITAAVDSITVGPTDAAGTTDVQAPTDASGIDVSAGPTDAAGTGSTASTASAYTTPTITTGSELTVMDAVAGEETPLGTDADFDNWAQWFNVASEYIEDEEDVELANAQISKIRTFIDAFKAEVQDAQAAMQALIEDARQSTQASIATAGDATRASIANAQNDVSVKNASIASQTQASIANASNDVSTNNASMQTLIQASIANAQNDVQASIAKMRESTAASIQKMQLSTNVNVTNAAKTMEALIQDYSALVTETTSEYNWFAQQQVKLQADYDRGIQFLAKG